MHMRMNVLVARNGGPSASEHSRSHSRLSVARGLGPSPSPSPGPIPVCRPCPDPRCMRKRSRFAAAVARARVSARSLSRCRLDHLHLSFLKRCLLHFLLAHWSSNVQGASFGRSSTQVLRRSRLSTLSAQQYFLVAWKRSLSHEWCPFAAQTPLSHSPSLLHSASLLFFSHHLQLYSRSPGNAQRILPAGPCASPTHGASSPFLQLYFPSLHVTP
mmetsp:Transcript_53500/g.122964  ORF Transcript_53500/g.122964 Transcript_53500/m.122964 type:complete len:215 (-) Transcript_53500:390-1034(-)